MHLPKPDISPGNQVGTIGNLTILPNDRMPVLYYLTKETLWQYVNETTILPVNVHNVTESALKYRHPPFQLVIGRKIEGIRGSWRFAGSMLYYEFPGKEETQGLFFKCEPSSGFSGVFMFYQQYVAHLFASLQLVSDFAIVLIDEKNQ
ncbi:hypothetical protein CC1G_00298 [Coprinopsis cinerea okayama7|uniref:Uncharacterized protein n=1 Tax=Coprinopsis cinerea (strain Okayama-7 / 130 / ATCC MYA-4618 / FGSC 9003) TaxID=240176 RepID=A8NXG6_COPC7|nr:hypothetical protein CC1G_00298 [Coprinopsis cinerea okayama7\|eukprot:XP_001837162.2 hypothetical protein CC1G_00298 [Coprinopsis cinerea okayama7\